MHDTEDYALEAFMGEIQDPLLSHLTKKWAKTQIVGQSELLPCVASRELWADWQDPHN